MNALEVMATLLPDVLGWERGWPYFLTALVAGYLAGSIPFGVLITRIVGLGDLRQIGSGNIGATNVLRTGNKKAAAATLALDMVKGWAVVVAFLWSWGDLAAQLAGIGAFFGHCFPVWLRFRGGKGVATFLGVILGWAPLAGLACCAAWLAVAALFRISSLAALLMALSAPLWLWLAEARGAIWAALPLIILLWIRHHENVRRLAKGEEPRIGRS